MRINIFDAFLRGAKDGMFYTLAVCLSAARIKKTGYILQGTLIATLVEILATTWLI